MNFTGIFNFWNLSWANELTKNFFLVGILINDPGLWWPDKKDPVNCTGNKLITTNLIFCGFIRVSTEDTLYCNVLSSFHLHYHHEILGMCTYSSPSLSRLILPHSSDIMVTVPLPSVAEKLAFARAALPLWFFPQASFHSPPSPSFSSPIAAHSLVPARKPSSFAWTPHELVAPPIEPAHQNNITAFF